ncbi:flavin reductase family protein [Candidatus Bathyarchaeota archaeon]|nr:MAG: flavin reductase family protein [Candidatus Bathyarchaeota archaeon]
MKKIEVPTFRFLEETIKRMDQPGLLLVSGTSKQANVMTIGWGLPGILWGRPFFIVAVRPSRYTYQFIEETGDFTVNVPRRGMEEIVSYCGTVSGRDHNKFKEKGLTLLPSGHVKSPMIEECIIHYECKVAYKIKVVKEDLPSAIISSCYPRGDYHTLYFGEIISVHADENLNLEKD